ncbi:MAG: ATP-dependent DNA helicase [Desulfatiglandales bacterium]
MSGHVFIQALLNTRLLLVDALPPRVYILPMFSPAESIHNILGRNGILAQSLEGYEIRPHQIEMAQRIQEALETKQPAIIEAGTGTGKTLGYLVPLYLSGKRAVISTGTKNLQDQVFFKDIPLLSRALGRKIDAMLMKGRTNYLCLYRYHQFFSQSLLLRPDLEAAGKRLKKWLGHTTFADRGELSWLKDDDPLWDHLSCASEQCLGTDCPHWEACYLGALRRRAAQSRIIIVNHHLFFADLMVKRGGFGEIIPRFEVAVFDEAHKIEEIATSYFGARVSSRQLMELVADVDREARGSKESGQEDMINRLDLIRAGTMQLLEVFVKGDERGRLDLETLRIIDQGPARMIRQGLRSLYKDAASRSYRSTALQACAARAEALDRALEEILSRRDANWLNWFERKKRGVVLNAAPLEIAGTMEEHLYGKVKTVIFTSATLSTNGNFDYFQSRLGLSDPLIKGIYPSHFDFEQQTLLYVPRDLPPPNDPRFGMKLAERIEQLLEITSGRALLLFTGYHNLHLVHQHLEGKIPYAIYRQGDAPKSTLLEVFRKDTHSILLATGSFWQGVDVPGEALSCLIIDKLPFDSPGDPLISARIDAIRSRNGNPFMEFQLPSAIISLKQGLGRLIRNSSDRGVLCVMDVRLIKSRYGHFFFESLPKMVLTHEMSGIGELLKRPE